MRFLRAGLVLGAIAGAFGLSFLSGTGAQPPGTDSFSICSRSDVISPPAAGSCTPVSAANPLPVNASVSASVTGFEPATTGTQVAADTDGDTQTLPAGDVVVAFNTSTSITAYCKLGATATTADAAIPPSSWFAFTVGAATQITCITASSTATLNTVGGAGLPTGAGGGGGSGGGGTSSSYGAAFPATGTAIGFTDGTNMAAGRVGAVANVAAATNFVNALGICQYLASAPTLTDTRFNQLQCDISGYLRTTVMNTNANGQATMANSSPVAIASDQTMADRCTYANKSSVAISQAASAVVVSASASNRIYVCSLTLIAGAAEVVNLVYGTGSTCGTGTTAIIGSTTVGNGLSFAANGGLTLGNGHATVAKGGGTNVDICLTQNSTSRVAGVMTYVLAP